MVQTRIVQLVDKDLYVDVSEDSLEIQTAGKTSLKNTFECMTVSFTVGIVWIYRMETMDSTDAGLGNQGYC